MATLKEFKRRLKLATKEKSFVDIEQLYKEVDEHYFKLRSRWDGDNGYDTVSKESNWEDFHEIVCTAVCGVRDGFDESKLDILSDAGYPIDGHKL